MTAPGASGDPKIPVCVCGRPKGYHTERPTAPGAPWHRYTLPTGRHERGCLVISGPHDKDLCSTLWSPRVSPDLPDDQMCSATYPALGPDFGAMCNGAAGHEDNHWALTVVAPRYRRYVVWTPAGEVLPDEETSLASAQGQTPPSEGDRVT